MQSTIWLLALSRQLFAMKTGALPSGFIMKTVPAKTIANWIINKKVDINKVSPEELVKMIQAKSQTASVSEKELEEIIVKVLTANPKAVADYKAGKESAIMFLLGQVMRETEGKADPVSVRKLLAKII